MPELPAADPPEVLAAIAMAVVIAAVVAERLWLFARTGAAHLRVLGTAAAMGVGSLLAGAVVTGALRATWPAVGALSPAPLVALVDRHVVVEVLVVFVAWDLAGYAYHRIGHGTAIGWASHQVHHTGPRYDLSLALRQSWFPLPAVATFPLVALTGGSFTVAVGCAAVSNAWQALVHTELDVRFPGWLASVVVTPATHRRHHDPEGEPVNLGAVLTCWDRLAGTWDDRPGLAGQPLRAGPSNPVRVELAGWRALVAAGPPHGAWGFAQQRPTRLDCGD